MKKNIIYILVVLYIVISGSYSCMENRSQLDIFFEDLENHIEDKNMVIAFKSTPFDSMGLVLPIFRSEYLKFLHELNENHKIKYYRGLELDSPLPPLEYFIWLLAFQKHLQGESISLNAAKKLRTQWEREYEAKSIQQDSLYKIELEEIIMANIAKWQIGDTLSLLLPIKGDNQYKRIYFLAYPESLRYSYVKDTLKVKGILQEKYYDPNFSSFKKIPINSPFNCIFRIKILELSSDISYYSAKKLHIGDEFVLHLESYGRPIE